jgi:hypothetical protein
LEFFWSVDLPVDRFFSFRRLFRTLPEVSIGFVFLGANFVIFLFFVLLSLSGLFLVWYLSSAIDLQEGEVGMQSLEKQNCQKMPPHSYVVSEFILAMAIFFSASLSSRSILF